MFSGRFDTSRITVQRSLKWILIAQAILATVLVLSHLQTQWFPSFSGNNALPTGPATPGDQVRRYEPTQTLPDLTKTPIPLDIDVPSEMPPRLQFKLMDAGDLGEALFMHGRIETGDAERLASFLASTPEPPGLITLHSPGGDVQEALTIGRSLRATEVNTTMLPGMVCLSSCPYIFAAGVERSASKSSAIGMHQHYYRAPGYMPVLLAVEGIQYGQGETMEYLIEMGIDPGLMVYSLKTPPEEIYILIEDELLSSKLATAMIE